MTRIATSWKVPLWIYRNGRNMPRTNTGDVVFDRSKGYRGYERSPDHKKMFEIIGKYIMFGYDITYEETGMFPDTIGQVTVSYGNKVRISETGATSKRKNPYVNDLVGAKRLRKDDVRSNGTGKKAVADVGRQRKRKPSTSR